MLHELAWHARYSELPMTAHSKWHRVAVSAVAIDKHDAKAEGMKIKDLYQWKTVLIRRGFVAKPIPLAIDYFLVV